MGRRLQARRDGIERVALLRLTFSYVGVFCLVIACLSVIAYAFVDQNYRSIVAPALVTPEGQAGFNAAMRPALYAILSLDGLLVLVVGFASFVLARAAMRPLRMAREREERFTADIAHELRTPLGAIASVAQAAAAGDPAEANAALATIARRAIESGALIGDLLTLARASDSDALVCAPVDLSDVVSRVCRDARSANPSLEIRMNVSAAIVRADERRLTQLVRNLIDNAGVHARSYVAVDLRAVDGRAELVIDDDGPGVAAQIVPRLFQRFAKGPNSTGGGLGLAICRWVADAHRGTLRYDGGARFVFTLRLYS